MYVGRIEKLLTYYTPMPMCIINKQGKVSRASEKIATVFKYDGIKDADIFQLTGIRREDYIEAATNNTALYIKRNDKNFKLVCGFLGEPDNENSLIVIVFIDNTHYENLKTIYNDEKTILAVVNIDNYDELIAIADNDESEMELVNMVDKLLREWVASFNGVIVKFREGMYEILMTQKDFRTMEANKFTILDAARSMESDVEFPVTLSIGVGLGGKSLQEADHYADEALELALGRGGDQVVVKNINNYQYYGGKTQSVEKSNKGKSRIIGHALKMLIEQSTKTFIMGHSNPDMDCFGAALGVHRIASSAGKEAYILLKDYNDTMNELVADAKATGIYEFISGEAALKLIDDNSLVIVVDTHRPGLLENKELVEKASKLVVIDHHRKAEDALPAQVLSYIESYASSASEMVTEMLEYVSDKKEVTTMEANALLAGIMLDTNRFAVKAGVRTFEAASWLKRAGADLQVVRKYFQDNASNFRAKAAGIANARIMDGGIAMSICEGESITSQITNSQVADELLTIKGVKASFVAGKNEKGETVVSARSLGDMNVQVIMEKFGGGGHMNTAGAKVKESPEEILDKIEEFLKTTQ